MSTFNLEKSVDSNQRHVDAQEVSNKAIEDRIVATLGAATTILPVTFGLIGIGNFHVTMGPKTFLYIATALYAGTIVLALYMAVRRITINRQPSEKAIQERAEHLNGDDFLRWLANEYKAAIEWNEKSIGHKGTVLGLMQLFFCLETGCLVVAGCLMLWGA